ncbi:MAG: XrtA/PEP-CTERM system histidine kinase PrsK [Thermodesulfobacteriota bacterium]|nr:XrtA/PEP-CTERM system histidine kinase PrsK [Thermodesulfobacteriota bacterium]
MIQILCALNLLLLLSCLLIFQLKSDERRLSLSLVQALLSLPLLAGVYILIAYHMTSPAVHLLLFSESVFGLIWFYMAHRLCRSTVTAVQESSRSFFIQISVGIAVLGLAAYFLVSRPAIWILSDNSLAFDLYGPVFFCALFLLISVLAAAWRFERFWRMLEPVHRWEYKFLVVGSYLVCGAFGWATSYRLTYQRLVSNHFSLLAALMLIAWLLISYAMVRHRLLNRRMFISRKVVYSFVAPSIFAAYLCVLGAVSMVMKTFGLPLPFVLRWLLLAFGLVALGLFATSGKLRRRVHFFISTHFYVNKYEYRDEWLALSRQLQGALSEADVVEALRQVLVESLYTTNLVIWLGDTDHGYRSVFPRANSGSKSDASALAPDDPLILFLMSHPYFYVEDREPDAEWNVVAEKKTAFLADLNLVLISPLFIGDQLVGLIGLGPEFTGGRYGHDDFDLLTALGTQAASALLSSRMAEKLAHAREQRAWDRLSAFVLHDVKNAATMLSLVRGNAPDHIQDHEFQQDMLEAVDDALGRMAKVQERLTMLKGEVTPVWQDLDLGRFLTESCRHLKKKLGAMDIAINCPAKIRAHTDPEPLTRILENLFLNALEAGGDGTAIRISISRDEDQGQAVIKITDDGPGIPENLLPDALFEPFKTTKPTGSGIGLWQARRLVTSLKGTIHAENMPEGGARFVVRLPLAGVGKLNSTEHSQAGGRE